jgi:hypothetical protein
VSRCHFPGAAAVLTGWKSARATDRLLLLHCCCPVFLILAYLACCLHCPLYPPLADRAALRATNAANVTWSEFAPWPAPATGAQVCTARGADGAAATLTMTTAQRADAAGHAATPVGRYASDARSPAMRLTGPAPVWAFEACLASLVLDPAVFADSLGAYELALTTGVTDVTVQPGVEENWGGVQTSYASAPLRVLVRLTADCAAADAVLAGLSVEAARGRGGPGGGGSWVGSGVSGSGLTAPTSSVRLVGGRVAEYRPFCAADRERGVGATLDQLFSIETGDAASLSQLQLQLACPGCARSLPVLTGACPLGGAIVRRLGEWDNVCSQGFACSSGGLAIAASCLPASHIYVCFLPRVALACRR